MISLTILAQAAPQVGENLAGGALGILAIFWILGLAATFFWLWMLFDALANEPTTEQKLLWFLVIFFLPFLGALAYLIIRKSGRGKTSAMG